MVGADAGGLVGCGGLGMLGSGNGGGFGVACSGGVLLGLLGAYLGFGDLAGGMVLGGGVVGLLAAALCGVALGLGVPAALDFFGKAGFGDGNALVGVGAGGIYLGFG